MSNDRILQIANELLRLGTELKVLAGEVIPPPVEDIQFQYSPSFPALNMTVQRVPNARFKLAYFFTTYNGSWDASGSIWATPKWAKDKFLRNSSHPDFFDDAGGQNHLYGMVLDPNGSPKRDVSFRFKWPDGYTDHAVKLRSGWANEPIYSSFDPSRGESGVWSWWPLSSTADIIAGGGLPLNHHVSSFAVWQEVA